MLIETLSINFRRARSVNQTSSSYVSKSPTPTMPSGDAGTATGASVITLSAPSDGSRSQNAIFISPYGTGSNNSTMNLRVIAWHALPSGQDSKATLWIPNNLGEFLCTLSAVTGADGTLIDSTNRFADTIVVTVGSTLGGEAASENIISPANDTIASILLDLKGAQIVELSFNTNSSATDCNALIAHL